MTQSANKQHVLTVLLEDYFQVGAFDRLIDQQNWDRFEPRFVENTLKTLDLLDRHNTKATFFAFGWTAENTPDLIREIVDRGHEVASRGYDGKTPGEMMHSEFRDDLRRTRVALERAAGQRVVGHRAAEKLLYSSDRWTLEVLSDEGFQYDASFLPTMKSIGRDEHLRFAHQEQFASGTIWELPYSTTKIAGRLLPISGGNYFRQLPFTFMRRAIERWHENSENPFVMYFHIWELDPEQPRIRAASTLNRIRHYRKLDKMRWILEENLARYNFTSAANWLGVDLDKDFSPVTVQEQTTIEISSSSNNSIKIAKQSVTVVVPCYNEENTLAYLANTLKSVEKTLQPSYNTSFIFVDDCSRDQTFPILEQLFGEKTNVRILRHTENKGVAAAIMSGLRGASTEIVCSIDADCTYDPHELARMIPRLEEGVDLVTASPYHPTGAVRNVPAWRLGLSKGASWLYRRTLRAQLYTYTSCFRVYRRSVVAPIELENNGFLGVAELLGKLDLSGAKIVEHPAILERRLFGFSKMKTVQTVFGHLGLLSNLAVLRFRNNVAAENSPKAIQPQPTHLP